MKNRKEREAEMYSLMQTSEGRDQIIGLFAAIKGFPKPGTLLSYMIEVVLDGEFPV